MSNIIEAAVEALGSRFDASEFDGTAKFVIEGEGALRLDSEGVHADDGDADVTMTADADTFQEILSGELNPTAAFMAQRLTIEGDMGMAMKLAAALS